MKGPLTQAVEGDRAHEEALTRTRQQAAVADLGCQPLMDLDMSRLLEQAAATAASTLDVEYSFGLEQLPGATTCLLRAGVGWEEGAVGRTTGSMEEESETWPAASSCEPVFIEELGKSCRGIFLLLRDRGVRSCLSIPIRSKELLVGALGVATVSQRTFTTADRDFVGAVLTRTDGSRAAAISSRPASRLAGQGLPSPAGRGRRDPFPSGRMVAADSVSTLGPAVSAVAKPSER